MRDVRSLENRVAELEEEVRQLREILRPDIYFPPALKLTRRQSEVLSVLYARPNTIVSRHKLEMLIWQGADISRKLADMHVYALKRKLAAHGVQITSIHGRGWTLTEAAKARLDALGRTR